MGGEASATRTGETLEGRYHLDRHLADDGPAEVYAATDVQGGSAVVVRLLRPEYALRPKDVESFVSLPKALAKLTPPHMVRVFAVTSDDTGIPYVVEEAPTGQTLAELLAECPEGLAPHDAKRILGPVIEALARLHMAGVVHGQVDPRRILLVPHAGQRVPRLVHYTLVGDESGVFESYRAPEHRVGNAVPDATMDVWSLGVLLHHVFSGRLPSAEPTAKQVQQRMPGVAAPIASAISECLCDDVNARLSDAAVLWMRLEGAFQQIKTPEVAAVAIVVDEPIRAPEPPVVAQSVAAPEPPSVEATPPTPSPAPEQARAPEPAQAPVVAKPKPVRAPIVHLPGMDPTPRPAPTAPAPSPTLGTQSRARTPGAINDEAMRRLLALNRDNEHRAWPWVRVGLLLLLLLLFWRAVPMLIEPDFAAARRVFGPQLKIAGIALSVVSIGALFATRALFAQGNALVTRPVAYVSRVVVLCICAIVGGSLIWGGFGDPALGGGGVARGGAGWRVIGGAARTALPYGMTLLLMSGALMGLMHGLRSLRDSLAMAIAAMLLAAGGGAVSVDLALSTIQPQILKLRDKAKGKDKDTHAGDDGFDLARLKQSLKPKKVEISDKSEPNDMGTDPKTMERTSIGDEGDDDMMGDDIRRQRTRQMDIIKSAEKELPSELRH